MIKQKIRNYAVLGLSLALLTVSCEQSNSSNKKGSLFDRLRNNSQKEQNQSEYFPISIGNTWTFKKTVEVGSSKVQYFVDFFPESGSFFKDGSIRKLKVGFCDSIELEGERLEEYIVIGKQANGSGSWNIKINGKSPRDGRYTKPFSPQTSAIPSIPKIISFTNWTLKEDGTIRENTPGVTFDGTKAVTMKYLTKLIPDEIISPDYSEKEKSYAPIWHVGSRKYDKEIITPVGKFNDVLECVTMLNVLNPREVLYQEDLPIFKKDLFDDGDVGKFTTRSYYAKGVGLVKEVQYDRNNKKTALSHFEWVI